jgi:hypothetical protein
MNLLSDAMQSQMWSELAPLITKGKTLYFSHGFSVVYKEDTGVIPPKDIDIILVAPKGSGRTVRTLFKEGRGIDSLIAVLQDVSGSTNCDLTQVVEKRIGDLCLGGDNRGGECGRDRTGRSGSASLLRAPVDLPAGEVRRESMLSMTDLHFIG